MTRLPRTPSQVFVSSLVYLICVTNSTGKARKEKITLQEERETKERKCVQLIATNNNLTKERQHLSGMPFSRK